MLQTLLGASSLVHLWHQLVPFYNVVMVLPVEVEHKNEQPLPKVVRQGWLTLHMPAEVLILHPLEGERDNGDPQTCYPVGVFPWSIL